MYNTGNEQEAQKRTFEEDLMLFLMEVLVGLTKTWIESRKNTDSSTVKYKFYCILCSPFAHKTNDYGHKNQLKFKHRSCELIVY
jgi:hypothetical protein